MTQQLMRVCFCVISTLQSKSLPPWLVKYGEYGVGKLFHNERRSYVKLQLHAYLLLLLGNFPKFIDAVTNGKMALCVVRLQAVCIIIIIIIVLFVDFDLSLVVL